MRNEAGNAPKRRTAVFRGKYDRGVPWVFCGESGNDPGHRPWVLSRVVGSGGPEGEARRRSPKAKPEGEAPPKSRPILLTPLKRPTPTNTENSAQRTPSGGGTARNTTDERREGTADCTSRASSSSSRSQSPAGESNPPKAPAPGTFQNRAEVPGGQTDTKRRRDTKSPVSGPNETQSPSTHRRPEKTQTKEGDRPHDHILYRQAH